MTRRTRNESIAKCVRDDDCDSCWPCETACFLEGQHLNFDALLLNGTVVFDNGALPSSEEVEEPSETTTTEEVEEPSVTTTTEEAETDLPYAQI